MAVKLYVGNLAWSVTSDSLGQKFAEAGTVVSAQVITDKYSGRSRGFGFVEVETDEQAQKAIELFNGKDFEGRNIVVNIARPKEERPGEQAGGGEVWGNKPEAKTEEAPAEAPVEEAPAEEPEAPAEEQPEEQPEEEAK